MVSRRHLPPQAFPSVVGTADAAIPANGFAKQSSAPIADLPQPHHKQEASSIIEPHSPRGKWSRELRNMSHRHRGWFRTAIQALHASKTGTACKIQLIDHVIRRDWTRNTQIIKNLLEFRRLKKRIMFSPESYKFSRHLKMATVEDRVVGLVLMALGVLIWVYYTTWTIVTVSYPCTMLLWQSRIRHPGPTILQRGLTALLLPSRFYQVTIRCKTIFLTDHWRWPFPGSLGLACWERLDCLCTRSPRTRPQRRPRKKRHRFPHAIAHQPHYCAGLSCSS